MATRRQRQVANLIQEEVSDVITRKVRDPRVAGVTITDVDVTPDLRYADIYFSKLGDDEERKSALTGLNAASGFLRRELAPRLELRYMPELRFHEDRSWEEGSRIDALLDQISAEEQEETGEPEED